MEKKRSGHINKLVSANSRKCTVSTSTVPILTVDEQLKYLKPSREILYYRKKIVELTNEYQDMLDHIEKCEKSCDVNIHIQQELQRKCSEVSQLQESLSDLQVYLYQEREQVLRLYAENDKLKIQAAEDRKKINLLLSLQSMSEMEIAHRIRKPTVPLVHQRPPKNIRKFDTKNSRDRKQFQSVNDGREEMLSNVMKEDTEVLHLKIQALAAQLDEQTRLFHDELHSMLKDRDLYRKEAVATAEQLQDQITSLTSRLKETEEKLCDTLKDMVLSKEKHCKDELAWISERESFLHTMQSIKQQLGSVKCGPTISGSGTYSSKEAVSTEIASLKDELSQRDSTIFMYQEQCVLLEEQVTKLKQHTENNKKVYQVKTHKLLDQVTTLKRKYDELDRRRRLESEGFRTDIRFLRNRLREVERSLLKLSRGGTGSIPNIPFGEHLLSSVADTVSRAQLLGKELQNIQKKVKRVEKSTST